MEVVDDAAMRCDVSTKRARGTSVTSSRHTTRWSRLSRDHQPLSVPETAAHGIEKDVSEVGSDQCSPKLNYLCKYANLKSEGEGGERRLRYMRTGRGCD